MINHYKVYKAKSMLDGLDFDFPTYLSYCDAGGNGGYNNVEGG